jgi:hypothetical protein
MHIITYFLLFLLMMFALTGICVSFYEMYILLTYGVRSFQLT